MSNNKMNLKGGVIIIGSLLWDNAKRCEWRRSSLEDLETKVAVPLKIRYGRLSGTNRCHTYTMIFSNHPTTGLGQGYVVGFKRKIESEEMLSEEVIALAKAEGTWTGEERFKNWGVVGLLANESKPNSEAIKLLWARLFQQHKPTGYDHSQYRIGDERPVITNDGFLHLEPTFEMNDFDFLLATPTLPNPKRALTPREVGDKMIKQNYRLYFNENIANNITTFQDDEIKAFFTLKA